jgi:hypothetical protein
MANNEARVSLLVTLRDLASRGVQAIANALRRGVVPASDEATAALRRVESTGVHAGQQVGKALADGARQGTQQAIRSFADLRRAMEQMSEEQRRLFKQQWRAGVDSRLTGGGAVAPQTTADEVRRAVGKYDVQTMTERQLSNRIRDIAISARSVDAGDPRAVQRLRENIAAHREYAQQLNASAVMIDRLSAAERKLDDRVAKHAAQNARALRDQTRAAGDGARGFTGLATGAADAASKIGTVLTALAALAAGSRFYRFLFDTNVEFQRLKAQLQTFEGDAENAEDVFIELRRAAVLLPGELGQLTQAYITLRGAGVRPTMEMMSALSGVAVSMGRDIESVASAIRAAAAGYTMRLRSLNIMAKKEGDELTVTYAGVTKKIKASAADITKYLVDLGRTHFPGAAERQMLTLQGRMEKLTDSAKEVALQIGRGGFNDLVGELIEAMYTLTESLGQNTEAVRLWTGQTVEYVRSLGIIVVDTGRLIVLALKSIVVIAGALVNEILGFIPRVLNEALKAIGLGASAVGRFMQGIVDDTNARSAEALTILKGAGDEIVAIADREARAQRRLADAFTEQADATKALTAEQRTSAKAMAEYIDAQATAYQLNRQNTEALNNLKLAEADLLRQIALRTAAGADANDAYGRQLQRLLRHVQRARQRLPGEMDPDGGESADEKLRKRIDLLTKAAAMESTRARAVVELTRMEGELADQLDRLNRARQEGQPLSEKEITLRERLAAVTAALGNGIQHVLDVLALQIESERERGDAITSLIALEQRYRARVEDGTLSLRERKQAIDDLARAEELRRQAEERAGRRTLDGAADRALGYRTPDGDINTERFRPGSASPPTSREQRAADRRAVDTITADTLKALEPTMERIYGYTAQIGTKLGEWADHILGADTEMHKLSEVVANMIVASFGALGDAVTDAFAAMVTGSERAGRAFKRAMLSAIAEVAKSEGMRALAKAAEAGAQALLNPATAGASLAAAAKYAAAATAYFAVAGLAQGGAQGSSGGGGGGGGSAADIGPDRTAGPRGDRPTVYLQMPGGKRWWDTNDPDTVEEFKRFFETLTGSDVIVLGAPGGTGRTAQGR